jgi:pimeloyl-ACP methyl ester carboxylesterase
LRLLSRLPLSLLCLLACSCVSFKATSFDDSHDRYYVVESRRTHVSVDGEGPAVVLSAGAGVKDPRAGFAAVTAALRDRAMTVVFDRPGFGKSETTTGPRDADTSARRLDELLTIAGIPFPVVLVGHSIGSFDVLRYAQLYPGKVTAVVLLDGTPPPYVRDVFKGPPKELVDMVAASRAPRDLLDEMLAYKESAAKIEAAGSLGEIPLTYIYADTRSEDWNYYQSLYEGMSAHARGVTTGDSEHYIHKKFPQLVAAEVSRFLPGR